MAHWRPLFGHRNLSFSLMMLSILLTGLSGCEDLPFMQEKDAVREFTIPAGEHYATPRLFERTEVKSLVFLATFDESARYALDDASEQSDINKLMGFSDCSEHHHTNSARFGWRWYGEQLEIHAYCYVDGVRVHALVGTVDLGSENRYKITATTDAYEFFLNGEKKVAIPRTQSCDEGTNYLLYPYFGGSDPAPHDVRIRIEMLN